MPNNELGDFQTPPRLAALIVERLSDRTWDRLLEPTCGSGSFLAAGSGFAIECVGIEVQPAYAREARTYGTVIEADIFDMDFARDVSWKDPTGSLLVIGNPPWVTNSQLGSFGSLNLPDKRNIRGLRGIEAMTGASNFDIAEYIWLKLVTELVEQEPTIALLCKTIVARNVLTFSERNHLPIESAAIYVIDAKKWFGVSVDACLFVVTLRAQARNYNADWYSSLLDQEPKKTIGVVDGRLISDIAGYEPGLGVDGTSPVEWRQGIKHDAAAVMEIISDDGRLTSKSGDPLELEPDFVLPLLKCTAVYRGRTGATSKRMVVPHRSLKDDLASLSAAAPLLWRYLDANGLVLDGRKSSIYRNRPRFCIFGVGDYSFTSYKVAVSGLHKAARFRAVGPIDGLPVVFDDTCYFVPVDSAKQAAALAALLNSSSCQKAIDSLAFWDAKRPITKKLLQHLDLAKVAGLTTTTELRALAEEVLRTDLLLPADGDPLSGLDELLALWRESRPRPRIDLIAEQATLFGWKTGARASRPPGAVATS